MDKIEPKHVALGAVGLGFVAVLGYFNASRGAKYKACQRLISALDTNVKDGALDMQELLL